jgi:hypothetical protein
VTEPQQISFWRRIYCYLKACADRQRAVLPGPDLRGPNERRIEESGADQVDIDRRMVARVDRRW